MIALRFVRLIETHSDELTAGLIRSSVHLPEPQNWTKSRPTNFAIAPERYSFV